MHESRIAFTLIGTDLDTGAPKRVLVRAVDDRAAKVAGERKRIKVEQVIEAIAGPSVAVQMLKVLGVITIALVTLFVFIVIGQRLR